MTTKLKEIEDRLNGLTEEKVKELTTYLKDTYGIEHEDATIPAGSVYVMDLDTKTSFSLKLTDAGSMKLHIVKTVKEITGLGLKEAKDMVESLPRVIKQGLSNEEAELLKSRLVEFGATVEIV